MELDHHSPPECPVHLSAYQASQACLSLRIQTWHQCSHRPTTPLTRPFRKHHRSRPHLIPLNSFGQSALACPQSKMGALTTRTRAIPTLRHPRLMSTTSKRNPRSRQKAEWSKSLGGDHTVRLPLRQVCASVCGLADVGRLKANHTQGPSGSSPRCLEELLAQTAHHRTQRCPPRGHRARRGSQYLNHEAPARRVLGSFRWTIPRPR